MSRKRPQEEYSESLAGRFKRWLDGEKDPFVGTLEMKPPAPVQEPEEPYGPSDYEAIRKKSRDYPRNKRLKGYGHVYRTVSVVSVPAADRDPGVCGVLPPLRGGRVQPSQ